MTAISDLLAKWDVAPNVNLDNVGYWIEKTRKECADEVRAAIAADISATTSAEQIVRALAVVKRGSEKAHDLAGEAVMWVAKNGDCIYRQAIRNIWPFRNYDRVRAMIRALIHAARDSK